MGAYPLVHKQKPEVETSLLNVDLDIDATFDLARLVSAIGGDVLELYTGPAGDRFQTHLELMASDLDAQTAIQKFIDLIERLDSEAKQLWNDATTRTFNIGIQGGTAPRMIELVLEPECLAAVAHVGVRIVITVYAAPTETSQGR